LVSLPLVSLSLGFRFSCSIGVYWSLEAEHKSSCELTYEAQNKPKRLWACLVDRPNSEYFISVQILLLFVSPVCSFRHCRTYTESVPRACPVAKLESSFPSELSPTRPKSAGPTPLRPCPGPLSLFILSHVTLSPRAPPSSDYLLPLPPTTPTVAPPQAGAPAAAEVGAHRRRRGQILLHRPPL
jgi:hypothetical protein